MSHRSTPDPNVSEDPVSNALKWILLAVAIGSFGLFAWATVLTYERAPPQPLRYLTQAGATVMTGEDIIAGKSGFQKADLMDYGSLYGMGSYFGQDYTAFGLMRLAALTKDNLARARFAKPFDDLAPEQQAAVRETMRAQLQQVDLTRQEVIVPDALAGAIATLRIEIADRLASVDLETGWTPAYSLSRAEALQTADFLIYSALTTVARRPNVAWSWTENWPYEPEVGNTPTANTFIWTWASFCFTFLAFGLVLFIYEFWLNHPDDAPMDPVLAHFRPLTESQRKVGKYFLVVAAVLLLQIAAGTIMAHAYYDRRSFYGLNLHDPPAVQLPPRYPHPGADHLDRRRLDRGRAVPGPGHRRRTGSARPGIAGGRAVLRHPGDRRRRPDRQLARHHGLRQWKLVLVRQPGPVLYPAWAVLADRLLPRIADLERAGVPRAVADRARRCGRRPASSGRAASGWRT